MGVKRAYEVLSTGKFDVDDICAYMNVTHKQLRKYIASKRTKMPAPTPGLLNEVLTSGMDPAEASRQYRLSQADIQVIFYRGLSSKSPVSKITVKKLIDEGLANEDIAMQVGCTAARVSQIRRELDPDSIVRKRRNKLKKPERIALKEYADKNGVKEAAKKFNVALATAYRIVGE